MSVYGYLSSMNGEFQYARARAMVESRHARTGGVIAVTRYPWATTRYGARSSVSRRLTSRITSAGYAGEGHAGSTVAGGIVYESRPTRVFAARTAASIAGAMANVDWLPRCVATAMTDDVAETTGRPASARDVVRPGRALPSSPVRAAPRRRPPLNSEPNATSESPPLTSVSPPTGSTRYPAHGSSATATTATPAVRSFVATRPRTRVAPSI